MPQKLPSEIEVIVTLDESHVSQSVEVAKQLAAKGFRGIETLESIGVITGKCAPDLLNELRAISGIATVEPSGSVQIAPPESDIQ